jgi:hypothetical protein
MAKNQREPEISVRELTAESLPDRPENATTTTDAPVSKETRRTIAAVLMHELRKVAHEPR